MLRRYNSSIVLSSNQFIDLNRNQKQGLKEEKYPYTAHNPSLTLYLIYMYGKILSRKKCRIRQILFLGEYYGYK